MLSSAKEDFGKSVTYSTTVINIAVSKGKSIKNAPFLSYKRFLGKYLIYIAKLCVYKGQVS